MISYVCPGCSGTSGGLTASHVKASGNRKSSDVMEFGKCYPWNDNLKWLIFYLRKRGLERKGLAQGHTARKHLSWNSSTVCKASNFPTTGYIL